MEHSMHDGLQKQAALSPGLSCEGWPPNASNGARWNTAPDASTLSVSEQSTWLAQTIETEIIPRLMLAHQVQYANPAGLEPEPPAGPTPDDVIELAQRVLDRDAQGGNALVRRLRMAGAGLEAIYLELLAPAARRLGAMWEADLCSFAEVTIGLWRLQQLMRDVADAAQPDAPLPMRRALLVPVPGSQHTMGFLMVSEFFRRAGWDVWGDATMSVEDIQATVHGNWFDLVGLSIGSHLHVGPLASVILAVRKASRNAGLAVMIGGPIVVADPTLVAQVGADEMAVDGAQAVDRAEGLLAVRAVRA